MRSTPTKSILICAYILAGIALTAQSKSVTVNSNGGADFTTITDALASVNTTPTEENVITITGGGPYEEIITISVPLTLRGSNPDNRPIILLRQIGNVSQYQTTRSLQTSDGIVNLAAGNITLENLIIIPSFATPPGDAIDIEGFSSSDHFSVTFRNLLVTANNFDDKPVTLDGLERSELLDSEMITFSDDALSVLTTFGGRPDATIDVLMENVVCSHTRTANASDGFILGGRNVTATLRNVVSSYNARFGFQLLSAVTTTFEGTAADPIIVKGNGTGITDFSATSNTWSHVYMTDNLAGLRIDNDGEDNGIVADHLLIANNSEMGLLIAFPVPDGSQLDYSFSDCTFYENKNHIEAGNTAGDFTTDRARLMFTDSIFADDDAAASVLLSRFPAGVEPTAADFITATFTNCALVESGPAANAGFGERVENITETNTITDDPAFLSTDPADPGYLRVTAASYARAGSDAGPLEGVFLYAGQPPVSVSEWMMF